jgi:multiple sugar transport system substrate-binding protein
MFFAITKETRHAREAAQFINWFINSVSANKLLLAERGVPVSRKIQKKIRPLLSPLQRHVFDFVAYITENGIPTPPAEPEANIAVRDNIYYLEVVDPVMYKVRSPEEAAAIFRLMATEVLARN